MKNETLKQIINQIKKYALTESFSNAEEFKKWALKLNGLVMTDGIQESLCLK